MNHTDMALTLVKTGDDEWNSMWERLGNHVRIFINGDHPITSIEIG